MPKARIRKQALIKAIEGSGGIVMTIAQRLGVGWHTADTYIKRYPEALRAYEDENEKALDAAEGVILSGIAKGDSQDAKWYLTKKGKARGYGDVLKLDVSTLSDDEIIRLLALANRAGPDAGSEPARLEAPAVVDLAVPIDAERTAAD